MPQEKIRSIMKERKMTAKQQKFAEEYLIDLNATRAAIRAGYSVEVSNDMLEAEEPAPDKKSPPAVEEQEGKEGGEFDALLWNLHSLSMPVQPPWTSHLFGSRSDFE